MELFRILLSVQTPQWGFIIPTYQPPGYRANCAGGADPTLYGETMAIINGKFPWWFI
jgi:hypothetical protein